MDRDLELKRRTQKRVARLCGDEHRDFNGVLASLRWNVWSYPDERGLVRFQVPVNQEYCEFFLEAKRIDQMTDAELLKEIEVQRAMILIAG